MIEAKSEGNTKVKINLSDEEGFDKLFGSYANDPRIKFDKTADKTRSVDVTVYDAGLLLNRGITYYLFALVTGIFTLVAHLYFGKIAKARKNGEDSQEDQEHTMTLSRVNG